MVRIDARGNVNNIVYSATGEYFSPRGIFYGFDILPGFTDVHVHLREPGFFYKETIKTGTEAAAAGGFVNVVTMPNLNPVPDSLEHLKEQTDIIAQDACIGTYPLASITKGEKGTELSDIEALAPQVKGFSDDGVGVMDDGLMREAMERIKEAGSIAVAHCEDTRYPRESRQAEYKQLERDLKLADITGCPYHMCHASTIDSIQLIREAKASQVDVTCETAPHYLTIANDEIEDDGRFKMNPPLKTSSDRAALIEAVLDGTIDMIATDHAPHSAEEKAKGFAGSAFGIVGLETAFPVLYTKLVKEGLLPMDRLLELLTDAPNKRFHIPAANHCGQIHIDDTFGGTNLPETFAVWDLETPYTIEPDQFKSKGKSTPFAGWKVYGKCVMTVYKGQVVYRA